MESAEQGKKQLEYQLVGLLGRSGEMTDIQNINNLIMRWEHMGKLGFTVSVCFGPCGNLGLLYSVNVLCRNGDQFDEPYGAESFEKALWIAEKEIKDRGWI